MSTTGAVVSGIGLSQIGRRIGRDPWSLTADAALAAIADAGLSVDDIDGISTYPGAAGSTPGLSGAGVNDAIALLGLTRIGWYTGGLEIPGQLASVINAIMAIRAGFANHVLCFRTVWESTAQAQAGSRSELIRNASVREMDQWQKPYGWGYPSYAALMMQRYMHESGATREQIGQIAVVSRANAAHNPWAVYRDPMTIDDYMAARLISTPVCLLDCDVPIDGSAAVVVSRADSPSIDRRRSVTIQSVGTGLTMDSCAQAMWDKTTLKPSDVDVAELYDGFSILTVRWLESLGLCPRYEAGRFIEGGQNISIDGVLPLNTNGGQLSGGRLHGYSLFYEACQQLRGDASNQISRKPQVAAVSAGTDGFASCLLLTI